MSKITVQNLTAIGEIYNVVQYLHLNYQEEVKLILQPFPHVINSFFQELVELGEAVGTQNRGLSQEQISLLPVSKYKCGFSLRKKSRDER